MKDITPSQDLAGRVPRVCGRLYNDRRLRPLLEELNIRAGVLSFPAYVQFSFASPTGPMTGGSRERRLLGEIFSFQCRNGVLGHLLWWCTINEILHDLKSVFSETEKRKVVLDTRQSMVFEGL